MPKDPRRSKFLLEVYLKGSICGATPHIRPAKPSYLFFLA